MNTMTIAAESVPESTAKLKRELKSAEARRRAMALALVAPLAIFLLLIFVVPIGALLTRAVQNPEVADALPKTVVALKGWDRKSPPADAAYAVFPPLHRDHAEPDDADVDAFRNAPRDIHHAIRQPRLRRVVLDGQQKKNGDSAATAAKSCGIHGCEEFWKAEGCNGTSYYSHA